MIEVIAVILLLIPSTVTIGAILSLGAASGAIMSHLTKLLGFGAPAVRFADFGKEDDPLPDIDINIYRTAAVIFPPPQYFPSLSPLLPVACPSIASGCGHLLLHRLESVNILGGSPQQFRNAPGLGDTAARVVRPVAIKDFRHLA